MQSIMSALVLPIRDTMRALLEAWQSVARRAIISLKECRARRLPHALQFVWAPTLGHVVVIRPGRVVAAGRHWKNADEKAGGRAGGTFLDISAAELLPRSMGHSGVYAQPIGAAIMPLRTNSEANVWYVVIIALTWLLMYRIFHWAGLNVYPKLEPTLSYVMYAAIAFGYGVAFYRIVRAWQSTE